MLEALHRMVLVKVQVQCCFTFTETVRTIRDGELRSCVKVEVAVPCVSLNDGVVYKGRFLPNGRGGGSGLKRSLQT